jgi:hypothetical protein
LILAQITHLEHGKAVALTHSKLVNEVYDIDEQIEEVKFRAKSLPYTNELLWWNVHEMIHSITQLLCGYLRHLLVLQQEQEQEQHLQHHQQHQEKAPFPPFVMFSRILDTLSVVVVN